MPGMLVGLNPTADPEATDKDMEALQAVAHRLKYAQRAEMGAAYSLAIVVPLPFFTRAISGNVLLQLFGLVSCATNFLLEAFLP
jgi:hypothetical protein